MNWLTNKISRLRSGAKRLPAFLGLGRQTAWQEDVNRKLVYSLSPRKIPNRSQLKHLSKFLNPKEYLIVKICALVILANLVYLGIAFITRHIQYTPKIGGTYTEGLVAYPQTINPLYAINRDVDNDLSRLIYSRLFSYDGRGLLAPDLAAGYTVSADNKEYTIKIRSDVYWQDSRKLTADDILFTFNAITNPAYRSPLRTEFGGVTIAKVDEETVKFTLSSPYAPFLDLLTFGILPKNIWENIDPASVALNNLNLKPIGSGPYKFKSLLKDSAGDLKEYHLVASGLYYGPKPYIQNITFRFFPDYPEMISAFNDNQLDGLSYLPFLERPNVLAPDSLVFHELVQPEIVSIFFNDGKNKALADQAVRVALAQALDKDQIIKDIFAGASRRADGPILPTSFAYNPDLKIYGYDPAAASQTITKKPLTLTLTVVDANNNVALANEIKDYWQTAGVKVTLKTVSGEEAAAIIKNRNFESLIYGESVGGDPDVYTFWHSSQIGAGGLNLAGYNNSEADKLLAAARLTTDQAERAADYRKFQDIITADLPAIWLYSPTYTYVQAKNVHGFSGSAIIEPADRFASLAAWYLKTHKKIVW